MTARFRAPLTYPSPPRTEAIIVTITYDSQGPPPRLWRPTALPDLLEVFDLVDDEDGDEHRLAGYVFAGTVEREP